MRKFKRITSIILATLMVMSLFAAVPMTVNAAPPGDSGSGSGPGGTGTVITPTTDGDDYLTFTAEEAGSSVTLKCASGTLQYKINNSDWQSYTKGTQITLENVGDYVRFSGNNTTFNGSNRVSLTGKVACSGNVMSLRLNDYGEDQGLSNYCFQYMFSGCTSLTTAPELPATSLAPYCYNNMFSGCTSLTTAPELWATSLAENCYSYMFYACTSLTTAPELPATTLARNCYGYMFSGCTSLTTAPELPATMLEENCYNNMFEGCESLTTAPELPATSLAPYCYNYMFKGCTSLTTAPNLPATTLEYSCYNYMFSGCGNLTEAPELPATSLAYNCYSYMFNGCGRLTTAPELPATTLATGCYNAMFAGCTSLTTAPELPATTLVYNCYNYMFYGCSSIKLSETRIDKYRIPYRVSSDGNGTAGSYASNMFAGTGGTFTGTPELNKTYYMYRDYDYTTTDEDGFFFDDAVEVGSGDNLAEANGYNNLFNFKILGVQKKADVDVKSSAEKKDVRFVTVVNTNILKDADEYGYVFAKFDNKDDARTYQTEILANGEKTLTVPCTRSSNTISGDYGVFNAETSYKYITATVNGIGEDTVAARFYIKKGDNYYYAKYTNEGGEDFDVCAAAFNDFE